MGERECCTTSSTWYWCATNLKIVMLVIVKALHKDSGCYIVWHINSMVFMQKLLFALLALSVLTDLVFAFYFYPKLPRDIDTSHYNFPVPAIFATATIICFVHIGLVPNLLAACCGRTKQAALGLCLSILTTIPCVICGVAISTVIGLAATLVLSVICYLVDVLLAIVGIGAEIVAQAVVPLATEMAFLAGAVSSLVLARKIQAAVLQSDFLPSQRSIIFGSALGALLSGMFLQVSPVTIPFNLPIAVGTSGTVLALSWAHQKRFTFKTPISDQI